MESRQDRRLGPRPLGLHLSAAMGTWLSSRGGLPLWKSDSLPWNPSLSEKAQKLRQDVGRSAAVDGDWALFDGAVADECRRRLAALHEGLTTYRKHPYRRTLVDPPVIWHAGTTRLLDFGTDGAGASGPVVLFVPSLINRCTILDLTEKQSLMRWLAGRGMRPLLVDWGAPGEEERGFGLTDYIGGRLEAALGVANGLGGGPVPVAGYCMGGLLALALAARCPQGVARLALMASPWDFHVDETAVAQARAAAAALVSWAPMIAALGELPVDMIQTLFALIDPMQVPRKFVYLAGLDPQSAKTTAFVALEDWLNDGVGLAGPVAHECLGGWYGENVTGRGLWQVGGRTIDPAQIDVATLALIPRQDRIVPPAGAQALAAALPRARSVTVAQGHIGMVASAGARDTVWPLLADWLVRG